MARVQRAIKLAAEMLPRRQGIGPDGIPHVAPLAAQGELPPQEGDSNAAEKADEDCKDVHLFGRSTVVKR